MASHRHSQQLYRVSPHQPRFPPLACCAMANCLHPGSDKRLKAQTTQLRAMKTKRDPIAANSRAAPAAKASSVGKVVCIDQRLPPLPRWGKQDKTPREFPKRHSPAHGRGREISGIGVRSHQRALLLHTVLSWLSHQGNTSLGEKQQWQGHTAWSDAEPWEMNGLDSLEGKQLVGVGARKSCPVCGAGCAMKSHLGRVGPAGKRPQESSAAG